MGDEGYENVKEERTFEETDDGIIVKNVQIDKYSVDKLMDILKERRNAVEKFKRDIKQQNKILKEIGDPRKRKKIEELKRKMEATKYLGRENHLKSGVKIAKMKKEQAKKAIKEIEKFLKKKGKLADKVTISK